jgi:hypothetical protein
LKDCELAAQLTQVRKIHADKEDDKKATLATEAD